MKVTNASSIEFRSLDGIKNANKAIVAGDYDTVESLTLRLHHPFFKTVEITTAIEDALVFLMAVIGTHLSNKHLKSLNLSPCISTSGRCNDCIFPVKALAAAITNSKNMESLSIVNICLVGTKKEFADLAQISFAVHKKLQKLTLTCGHVVREDEDEDVEDDDDDDDDDETSQQLSPFDAVLDSIGKSIPTMKQISLAGGNILGDHKQFRPTTVASLFQHGALQKLSVFSIMLSNDALACLEDALVDKKNQIRLTELSLWCTELEATGCMSLAKILSTLSPSLKTVTLVIHSFGTGKNKTSLSDGGKAKVLLPVLTQGLGCAKCPEIRLAVPEVHVDLARECIVELLRTNYHITWLQFDLGSGHKTQIHDDEIEFLIKTNIRGRGNLFRLQDSNDHDRDILTQLTKGTGYKKVSWMDMFEATDNNLSHIYYLVRSHPKEFADMGLRDCSESMVPTTRVVKSLLRQSKQSIVRGLKTTVQDIEDNLQDELETLKYRIDDAPSALYEHLDDIQEEISDTLVELKGQLKATKQGIKDYVDKKLVKEVLLAMNEQTKCIQSAVDSKLGSFSRELPPKMKQELMLEDHKKDIASMVDSKLENLVSEIGLVFESKLKSQLVEQKRELEKAFEIQLETQTKKPQKKLWQFLFCVMVIGMGAYVSLLTIGIVVWPTGTGSY